mmetsp:Transcript_4851/g.10478  ORF Transcript_4851/g.10478 Transcript_4851/m.10478 type:complete len:200 (+) Transcript_4851:162-761(+)
MRPGAVGQCSAAGMAPLVLSVRACPSSLSVGWICLVHLFTSNGPLSSDGLLELSHNGRLLVIFQAPKLTILLQIFLLVGSVRATLLVGIEGGELHRIRIALRVGRWHPEEHDRHQNGKVQHLPDRVDVPLALPVILKIALHTRGHCVHRPAHRKHHTDHQHATEAAEELQLDVLLALLKVLDGLYQRLQDPHVEANVHE